MDFLKTELEDAYIIDIKEIGDSRGFFARGWCQQEFEEQGLKFDIVQANISFNREKGTLRGLHYQVTPHEEIKLVRCTRGSIFDVIVDLRPSSSTYKRWIGVKLTAENHRMLLVPKGCAHAFQTLENDTEIFYQVSANYAPDSERGARYNDPAFEIDWPLDVSVISDKDAAWPNYRE